MTVGATAGGGDASPGGEWAILQELVNRPGWQSGNHVLILIEGSGTRTAECYDGAAAKAPLLHVAYQ